MAFNIIEFVSVTAVVIAATTAALILPLKKQETDTVQPEAGSAPSQVAAPAPEGATEVPPAVKPEAEAKVEEIEREVSEARRDLDEIKAALRERAKENERRTQQQD